MDPYATGALLPPTPTPPKVASSTSQRRSTQRRRSTQQMRPCTGSRKTCRRKELRRRAKQQSRSRRSATKKSSNYQHNNRNFGSIPDKHEYIDELKKSLEDLIDMLYAAGRNAEAKEKEELLKTIKY